MKYVLMYESTPELLQKVPAHIAAHRELWRVFHADNRLLLVGPFTDAPVGGAMGIFSTRAAAEEFVRDDPFVTNGIVARWTIREWHEVLMPDQ